MKLTEKKLEEVVKDVLNEDDRHRMNFYKSQTAVSDLANVTQGTVKKVKGDYIWFATGGEKLIKVKVIGYDD